MASSVRQDGEDLRRLDAMNLSWRLNDVSGLIVVELQANREQISKEIDRQGYMVFQLTGDQGRHVRKPGLGPHLVIVPETWERDEDLAGSPSVHPEPCSIRGYRAHFFDLGEWNSTIAFRAPRLGRVIIGTTSSSFSLSGQRIVDGLPRLGELFIGEIPKIVAPTAGDWHEISQIIVGEEGDHEGSWRTKLIPNPNFREQPLPQELVERQCGWYLLRFYDSDNQLLESESRAFRYIAGIHDISVDYTSPIPSSPNGHDQAIIEFRHELGARIEDASDQSQLELQREAERTIATVPPDPEADFCRFRVSTASGRSVDIGIIVERLWWGVGSTEKEPNDWADEPLALPRDDLRATSEHAIWLRLPHPEWLTQVRVGFDRARSRPYAVRKQARSLAIPLREFGDDISLSQAGTRTLQALFTSDGQQFHLDLANIEIQACCVSCEYRADDEEVVSNHVVEDHLGEFFQKVTYHDLRKRMPELPHEIHRCRYCNYYAKADSYYPTESPTTLMEKHCENEHPGKRVSSIVVRHVEQIHDIFPDLPDEVTCKACGTVIPRWNRSDQQRHLLQHHKELLYTLE